MATTRNTSAKADRERDGFARPGGRAAWRNWTDSPAGEQPFAVIA
jgi:hypothetical protein